MNLLITGFKSQKQIDTFISWYSGQGEQDADIWFDCQSVKTPMIDDEQTNAVTHAIKMYQKSTDDWNQFELKEIYPDRIMVLRKD